MTDVLNILYVDDDENDTALLELYIKSYQDFPRMILETSETVAEAKRIFSSENHDAALIDWNLPDGEGHEVAAYIRNYSIDLPIIFLSGAFTEDQLIQAETYGPKACIEKNYSEAHIKKIHQLVQKRI